MSTDHSSTSSGDLWKFYNLGKAQGLDLAAGDLLAVLETAPGGPGGVREALRTLAKNWQRAADRLLESAR